MLKYLLIKSFLKFVLGSYTILYSILSRIVLYNKKGKSNYKFRNKFIFPDKQLIRENDCLFKEIFSKNIIKNEA